MLLGRIKCGSYWNNIHGYEPRALCSICRKKESIEIIENEQHIWLECENNGQAAAWEIARAMWERTTSKVWPNISLGLIRGTAALTFENDYRKDSERLRILISMTVWAIWKSRNKYSINDQDVAPIETGETLKELIREQVRKSWNATRFMKGDRRKNSQDALRTLWAEGRLAKFDLKTGPIVEF
jgi:hypothetical protein